MPILSNDIRAFSSLPAFHSAPDVARILDSRSGLQTLTLLPEDQDKSFSFSSSIRSAIVIEGEGLLPGAILHVSDIPKLPLKGRSRLVLIEPDLAAHLDRDRDSRKQLSLIASQAHHIGTVPEQAHIRNRATRDDSLEQYVKLQLLSLMTPSRDTVKESIIDIIPPGRASTLLHTTGSALERETWQARAWKMVDNPNVIMGWMLLGENGLRDIARLAKSDQATRSTLVESQRATDIFITRVEKAVQDVFARELPSLGLDARLFHNLRSGTEEHFDLMRQLQTSRLRAAQLMWLSATDSSEQNFHNPDGLNESIMRRLGTGPQSKPDWKALMQFFDEQIEPFFRRRHQQPRLKGMEVHTIGCGFNLVDSGVTELARDHRSYQYLHELAEGLSNGAVSAVGGKDYATARFPPSGLDSFVRGEMKIVVHDGDHGEGINWIFEKYGSTLETIYDLHQEGKQYDLRGMYGSFKRSLVTLRDGQQFLLVSSIGVERQISLAAAALLHETFPARERGSIENIILTRGPKSSKQRIHEELSGIFARENDRLKKEGCLDLKIDLPEQIPTRALTLMHGGEGLDLMLANERRHSITYQSQSLGKIEFRYFLHNGEIHRLIGVGIGSHGVYGSTAGEFVEACSEIRHCKLVPHVLGVSTAGGLIGSDHQLSSRNIRGVPDHIRSGEAYIVPRKAIADLHSGESIELSSLIGRAEKNSDSPEISGVLRKLRSLETELADNNRLVITDHHGTVSCPAVETDRFIENAVKTHGVASIDVEGSHLHRAATQKGGTFDAIYFLSDDPIKGARVDRYATYARMFFFAENTPPDARIYKLLRLRLELSLSLEERVKDALSNGEEP